MSYTLPFCFDHYFVTATFARPDGATPSSREGREGAWRYLLEDIAPDLEVRVLGPSSARTLCFSHGAYAGYRSAGQPLRIEDCDEHRRFLHACASRLRGSGADGERCTRLEGPARTILERLLPERPPGPAPNRAA